jgi:hypothetical protein
MEETMPFRRGFRQVIGVARADTVGIGGRVPDRPGHFAEAVQIEEGEEE